MKRNYLLFIGLFLGVLISFPACKKKEGCTDVNATNYDPDARKDDGSCRYATTNDNNNDNNSDNSAAPGFLKYQEYAFLGAIRVSSEITQGGVTVPFDQDLPVAFFTQDSGKTFLDAGTVQCEGTDLTKNSNNTYVFTPTNPTTTVSYAPPIAWTASGATWASFSYSTPIAFPNVASYTVPANIPNSASFTLSTTSVTNVDTVAFTIADSLGNKIVKLFPPGTTSYTFTASEMATLKPSNGTVEITGYKWEEKNFNGKKHVFMNIHSRVKYITITN